MRALNQFPADHVHAVTDEAHDVCRVDFDIATVDHHVHGVLERFPELVRLDADADFRALHVELARNVRVGGEDERVRTGHALLDDVEREVAHVGVAGGKANVWDDERHEEFFHGLLEGVKLVDGLGRFGVAADGVAGFSRVED